ncbi:MAG: ferrous iron transport protein A [Deltaproteobacteria bacterium]|nr:ferrous iron transport protein A [Deltaproteobacteria bacterium]
MDTYATDVRLTTKAEQNPEEVVGNSEPCGVFGIAPRKMEGQVSPLSRAPEKRVVEVVRIKGCDDFCFRLAGIGIVPGSTLKMRRLGSSCLVRTQRMKLVILDLKNSDRIIVR